MADDRRPKELDAQLAIMNGRFRRHFCLPNYTPRGWWECDVFEITAAGYFREYEIKLTVADFRADQKKGRRVWQYNEERQKLERQNARLKHALLKRGDAAGPVQFWYVTPAGLLFPEAEPQCNVDAVVPKWAGLIEVVDYGTWWGLKERRRAPRLHNYKVKDRVDSHARSIPYWRMHSLLEALQKRR